MPTPKMSCNLLPNRHLAGSFRVAAYQTSVLAKPRFHDLRQTSVSVLGEARTSERVIMEIARHVIRRPRIFTAVA